MAYKPNAYDTDSRTFAYKILWLGFPFSVVLSVSLLFESAALLSTLFGGFVAGLFVGLPVASNLDEFGREEIAFASNWALFFAGVVLFSRIFPVARDYPLDTALVLSLIALVFHAALTFRRLKDRVKA